MSLGSFEHVNQRNLGRKRVHDSSACRIDCSDIRAKLPASPPSSPEPFGAVLDDIDGVIMPGITHWQSPNFFAYFPANRSPVSILGELLSFDSKRTALESESANGDLRPCCPRRYPRLEVHFTRHSALLRPPPARR